VVAERYHRELCANPIRNVLDIVFIAVTEGFAPPIYALMDIVFVIAKASKL
jgi:hypothetical protein